MVASAPGAYEAALGMAVTTRPVEVGIMVGAGVAVTVGGAVGIGVAVGVAGSAVTVGVLGLVGKAVAVGVGVAGTVAVAVAVGGGTAVAVGVRVACTARLSLRANETRWDACLLKSWRSGPSITAGAVPRYSRYTSTSTS